MTTLKDALLMKNRIGKSLQKALVKEGWTIYDFYIEKRTDRGLYITIEFDIGDYCVGIYSKKGKWLLEPKKSFLNFVVAFQRAVELDAEVKSGKKWTGEDD